MHACENARAAGPGLQPAPATRLSRRAFFADFYVYPAAASGLFILAVARDPDEWKAIALALAAGIMCWTFTEYLLHRCVLHHVAWVKDQHDKHHEDEKALVGTPTWFSLLVFLTFVTMPVILVSTFGIGAGFTSGMMMGYLAYVTLHYGIHHWRIKQSGYLARLKRRHALHHRYDDLGNFGVTSGFWDRAFRTNVSVNRTPAPPRVGDIPGGDRRRF